MYPPRAEQMQRKLLHAVRGGVPPPGLELVLLLLRRGGTPLPTPHRGTAIAELHKRNAMCILVPPLTDLLLLQGGVHPPWVTTLLLLQGVHPPRAYFANCCCHGGGVHHIVTKPRACAETQNQAPVYSSPWVCSSGLMLSSSWPRARPCSGSRLLDLDSVAF